MSSPAAARGHEVRKRLLAAAVELIPERGWTAVSTRVLAERAGVSPSVVHYHFPSLPALLNEAVVGLMRQVLAEADASWDAERTPADAVDAMLAAVDRYTGADRMSLLFVEAYLAATRGRWLGEHGVPAPDETAAVLVAAVDGLLLHRGLGGPDTGAVAAVLHRLVSE